MKGAFRIDASIVIQAPSMIENTSLIHTGHVLLHTAYEALGRVDLLRDESSYSHRIQQACSPGVVLLKRRMGARIQCTHAHRMSTGLNDLGLWLFDRKREERGLGRTCSQKCLEGGGAPPGF